MSIVTLSSGESVWRGYEYFEGKKVLDSIRISDTEIKGRVGGSGKGYYEVVIDTKHPRKSTCNCPHANGKRIICKHMIALYFATYPEEAEQYYAEVIAYENEEEKWKEELESKIYSYVRQLEKDGLENLILELLFDGPEWQYERFVKMYIDHE